MSASAVSMIRSPENPPVDRRVAMVMAYANEIPTRNAVVLDYKLHQLWVNKVIITTCLCCCESHLNSCR